MDKDEKKKTPADFVMLFDGFAEIELSRPATIKGTKSASLKMREPEAGDSEKYQIAQGHEATREINTFANLCECTPDEIRKLPQRDYIRLQAAYSLFTN